MVQYCDGTAPLCRDTVASQCRDGSALRLKPEGKGVAHRHGCTSMKLMIRQSAWRCQRICRDGAGASVTAEVASSSLVVPAIHSKAVRRISLKPSRAQKGHVSRPFCAPFQRPAVSYPATSAPPSLSEEKTSDITAACAACFAGVIACV
jgi:hypothetical protein